MLPDSETRRAFVTGLSATVALGLAGCSGGDGGVQDSDGDGMIDSEDYAPNDPAVQEKADLAGSAGGTGQSTATTSADATRTRTGTAEATPTPTAEATPADVSYPSHAGTHTITARDNFWAWEFSVSADFLLEYSAINVRDENYDFDVLLYPPDRFAEYRAIATEREEGIRPQYLDGSAPGVTTGVEVSVGLPAGTYYLVLDNTDLSDAGDWGTEETRQIRLEARTTQV